jgi:hypothetical protein
MLRRADQPSLSRVAELAESAGASGLTVRTEIDGVVRDLPPDVEHAAFRVVPGPRRRADRVAARERRLPGARPAAGAMMGR